MKKEVFIFLSLFISLAFIISFSANLSATTFTCSTCAICTGYLTNASTAAGDTVQLINSITAPTAGSCVDFGGKDNVIFDCLNFSNSIIGLNASTGYGIYLNWTGNDSNNNTIKNCNISRAQYGIYAESNPFPTSTNITLTNIVVFNTSVGIYLPYAHDNNLTNMTITNSASSGVYIGSNSTMTSITVINSSNERGIIIDGNNTLTNIITNDNDQDGIRLEGNDNRIVNVISNNNRRGITLAQPYVLNNTVIINATFSNNTDWGIGAEESNYNLTCINITSTNMGGGIYAWNSFNGIFKNILVKNDFTASGMIFYGNSSNNTITNITAYYTSDGIYFSGNYGRTNNNTITDVNASSNNHTGISLWSSSNNTLTNIIVENNTDYGLFMSDSNGSFYDNITANKNGIGLYMQFISDNNLFTNIIANRNARGFQIYQNSNNNMFINLTSNNSTQYGFIIWNVNNNTLTNIITNNNTQYGIWMYTGAINNTLTNISTNNNGNYGIWIYDNSANNTFTNITSNSNLDSGIYINTNGTNNIIRNSYIQNNSIYGIYASSNYTLIYNNLFNNTKNYNSTSNTTSSFNTTFASGTNIKGGPYLGGNFWAYPNGTGFSENCTDSDLNGICDSSYNLSGMSYDYLPLALYTAPVAEENATTPASSPSGSTTGQITQTIQTQTFATILAFHPTLFNISVVGLDLTRMIIVTTEDIANVLLTILKASNPSNSEAGLPPGVIYQTFKINSTKLNSTNIANVTFEFKVDKNWLRQQNSFPSNIKLFRKPDSSNSWNPLATVLVNSDNNYYYYSALSPGFSTFLIFADKSECFPGEMRCSGNEIQLCLQNFTWSTQNKCDYLCVNAECVSQIGGIDFATIFYGVVIAIITSIILVIILILRNLRIIVAKSREENKSS